MPYIKKIAKLYNKYFRKETITSRYKDVDNDILYNKYFRKETITVKQIPISISILYNKYFRKETITTHIAAGVIRYYTINTFERKL